MVHMFNAQPQPTTRSAPPISSAARGEAKPPETSSDQGSSWKRPLATADVDSSAPQRAASATSPARDARAPRPATNTGRFADRSASTSWARSPSEGALAGAGFGGTTG